jgi:hypothetical protein
MLIRSRIDHIKSKSLLLAGALSVSVWASCDSLWKDFTISTAPQDPCKNAMCAAYQVCNSTSGACESTPLRFDGITPTTGSLYGGTQVTIKGAGLASDTAAKFGGLLIDGPVFDKTGTVLSGIAPKPTQSLRCRMPVDVELSNPRGDKIAKTAAFTYLFEPFTSNSFLPLGAVSSPVNKILVGNLDQDTNMWPDLLFRTETGVLLARNIGTTIAMPDQVYSPAPSHLVIAQSGPPTTGMSSAPYIVLGFAANHQVKLLQYYNGLVTENSFDSIYPLLAMTTADLDRDGLDEVIYAASKPGTQSSELYVLHRANLGSGFGRVGPFPVPNIVAGIAGVDLGGDPNLELVLTSSSSSDLTIFGWDGTRTLPVSIPLAVPGIMFGQVISADLDGDKKNDLAFLSTQANTSATLVVALNRPTRWDSLTFPIPDLIGTPDTELSTYDMNCDGIQDILINQFGPNPKTLFFYSGGNGTFTPKPPQSMQPNGALAVADINGDGFPDLLVGRNVLNSNSMLSIAPGNK